MTDLPKLSASTERKLQLRRETLLDKHGLTGGHLHWHEQELERICRAAAQDHSRSGSGWRTDECAADEVGIYASVTVAEARFNDLVAEYWPKWLSPGVGYEAFVVWLERIKGRVSSEDAALWKGHSAPIDCWYERACRPAVENALAVLVKKGAKRARDAEEKRLDSTAELDRLKKRVKPGPQPADGITEWIRDVFADISQEKPWSPAVPPPAAPPRPAESEPGATESPVTEPRPEAPAAPLEEERPEPSAAGGPPLEKSMTWDEWLQSELARLGITLGEWLQGEMDLLGISAYRIRELSGLSPHTTKKALKNLRIRPSTTVPLLVKALNKERKNQNLPLIDMSKPLPRLADTASG